MAKKKLTENEKIMQGAGMMIDDWFNGDFPENTPKEEKFGWVVLKFNYLNKGDQQMHYVSSANRLDMIKALEELVQNLKNDHIEGLTYKN